MAHALNFWREKPSANGHRQHFGQKICTKLIGFVLKLCLLNVCIFGCLKKEKTKIYKKMCNEECIGWRSIVVGKERPGLFQRAMANLSQGWSPEGEEGGYLPVEYPIDVVLGLEREARLTRLELTVIGWMAPHRVDIKLAKGRAFLPLDYEMAQRANYFEAGKIKFPPAFGQIDGQQNGMIGPKFRRAHFAFGHQGIQRPLRFIWLVLHSPHPMETNPKGKIALIELKIFGLVEERRTNSRRMRQLFPKFPIGGEKDEEEDLEDVEEEEEEGEGEEKIKRKEIKKIGEIFGGFGQKWGNYEGKRNSSKGRQFRQFGEAAEDFVQIEEKLANARQKAQKEGNVFRAMLLERALGDLGECQTKMFSLRSRRTIAVAQGREDEAEFLRGSMSNCMETYSRANQLDLLLETD